ncbi:MAG: molybdopterin-binding protein [Nanoarchaeota archaeon]|nr:molybdopterin-binding protein [Nanoarchaeota archaeon]
MKKIKIKVEDSVGKIFPHDITAIIPGKFKGPAFKKGRIIKKEDIPALLKIGKEKIWALEISKDEYHENEAAEKFRALAGGNVATVGPSEGKMSFFAAKSGLLLVDRNNVDRINKIRDVVLTTRHSLVPIRRGQEIAGIRVVPLATKKINVDKVLNVAPKTAAEGAPWRDVSASRADKLLEIKPFKKKKCAIIVTGSEVAKGRIKDKFRLVIEKKLKQYGSSVNFFKIVTDDEKLIKAAILEAKKKCDIIILTGGMSVDPDDVTRLAVKKAGAKIISYGSPVLPGNMFLASYLGKIPVLGIPACALFYKRTVFDIFLPLALADVGITRKNISNRGYGGLCLHCRVCVFPDCPFGKS